MPITNVNAPIGPGSAVRGFAVTKSDTTVFSTPTRYLYIGGTGDVAVLLNGDSAPVTFSAVPVGTVLPVSVVKVMSTNTTATLILGLY